MDLRPLHLRPVLAASAGAFAALAALGLAGRTVVAGERERTRSAVRAERRRIARELHDGLAQELAFLVTQAEILARAHPGAAGVDYLGAAARRALDEARAAMAGLTRETAETLDLAVEAAAEEVAHREGVELELELERAIDAPADVREALVRIVREAATNAITHGRANQLKIVLTNRDCIRLEVRDNGVGFEPTRLGNGHRGFGLVSMSERARALGGDLRVVSRPGAGTRIEVAVP